MYDITIDENMLMLWRNHTEEDLDMLILYIAKIPLEEAYDASLEKSNASFVASSDNISAMLIITFQRSFV
jgi:hypothetical protein